MMAEQFVLSLSLLPLLALSTIDYVRDFMIIKDDGKSNK